MIVIAETFIASATVVVKADTTQLRKDLAALSAQSKKPIKVNVTANTAGFANDLNKKIAAAKKQAVRVPVTPNMTGFLGKLRTEIKAAADKVVARVRVEPNMAGFQGRLQKAVSAAASKVTARVPVVPVAATGAARQTAQAAGGTKATTAGAAAASTEKAAAATVKATTAEKAFAEAEAAGSFARKRIAGDMTAEERRALSLQRELAALAAAEKAVTKAIAEQNPVVLANAIALQKSASAAVTKRQGTIAKAAPTERVISGAAAAAQAEKAERVKAAQETARAEQASAAKRIKAQAALTTEFTKQSDIRIANAEAEVRALLAADKASTRQRFNQRVSNIENDPAFQRGQEIRNARDKEAIAIQRGLISARRRLSVVDLEGAGATNAVSAARQRANAAETVTARIAGLVARARELNVTTLIQETEALHAKASAELRNQKTTLASAEAETTAAKAQAFRARGFIAQLATFAGLRGAVLAANAQFIAGTVAAIAFGKAVSSAASFESELNVFKVTAGATADEMARVSDAAKTLGRDVSLPAVSAGSAAQAMTELSKAGLSVEDSISGARGVLQLATAAQIDNAQATQFAASALNAFGLAGSDAVHVADVLTNAANASQGSIEDMAIAMQQASAVARQVGISFEDTVGFLTLLSRAGIQGSDAGTSLRVAFTRLINPTNKAKEILNDLNVQLRDARGNIRPEVFTDFAKAQENLSKKQQDTNAAVVFGTDALRAYSIIARAGVGGFAEVSTALEKQGSAAELANARMQGLTGSVENLKNQLSNLGLTLGKVTTGPLKLMADTLAVTASNASAVADALAGIVREAKKVGKGFAENVPQIKIGPIDTKEVDKSTGDFLRENAKKFAPIALGAVISPAGTLVAIDPVQKAIDQLGLSSKDTSKEIQKLLDDLNKRQDLPAFHAAIVRLKEMQQELAGGTKEEQKLSKSLGPFIARLQKLASQKPILIPFKLPDVKLPTALGGPEKTGSDAGRGIIAGLKKELSGASVFGVTGDFFSKLAAASTTSGAKFVHSGELTAKQFGEEVQKGLQTAFLLAVAEVNQGTQALTNAMNEAIIAGAGTSTLRSIAQKQLASALKIVADAKKRLAAIPKTEANKARRKKVKGILDVALETAAGLTGTVKGFTDQIASDAKSKADAIRTARENADQNILDSFAPARSRLSNAAARAAASPRIDDDIVIQKALIAQIKKERDTIFNTVKNVKTKTTEMRARTAELDQAVIDLKEMRKRRDQAIVDAISQEFAPRIAFAEATGNTSLLLKLLDNEISRINKEIRLAKKAKRNTQVLETALSDLKDTRNQTQDDLLAALRERAELRLQLGGGSQNAVINSINKQIAQKEKERRAVKKFGLKWVQLGNEILQLQLDKKDALDAAKDMSGTTVFDILKQNVETFNAVGGNLIQGNQPFPGPTGFTADVAQWLVALKKPPANLSPSTAAGGKTKFELNDDRLVRAMDRLTEATLQASGGGGQNATTQATVVGQRWTAIGKFWEAHSALRYQDANNG